MKRRTLDNIFSFGGLVFAALLVVLGFVIADQAAFANNYVATELSAQKITFAEASALTDAEKNWQPGSACLTTYAGQQVTTGPQAECYAKYFIREHMKTSAETAGFPGATYATLGPIRTNLTAQINAAKQKGDTTGAADLQKKFDAATSLRSTLQLGETLSGLLLTVYGFSVIAAKAEFAGQIMYVLAAIMVLISLAGFVHAYVTPRDKVVFGVPQRAPVTA